MASTRIPDRLLAQRKLPRQPRSRATVEAILEAAAQVFQHHGYAAGTTNRIAERAGVSIGTLYQYFPNKDAIVVALAREHLAQGTAALGPHFERLAAGATFADVLPGIVNAMVSLHALAPNLHRVLFEESGLPQTLHDELEQVEGRLVQLTADALSADRQFSGQDPLLAARIVIAAIEGLTHRLVLRPPAGVSAKALAEEITQLVQGYVHAP
jgi:AcrR family transcriptional regulator